MRTIVGVIGNVKHRTLNMEFTPEVYLPISQIPMDGGSIVARTSVSNPAAITSGSVPNWPPSITTFRWCASGSLTNSCPRAGPAALQRPAALDFCRHGVAAHGDRNLRRDGVFRFATHSEIGIRIALGAGKKLHLSPRRRSGHDDRGHSLAVGLSEPSRPPLAEQPSFSESAHRIQLRSSPSFCSSPPSRSSRLGCRRAAQPASIRSSPCAPNDKNDEHEWRMTKSE
jgi:hypothetical protein